MVASGRSRMSSSRERGWCGWRWGFRGCRRCPWGRPGGEADAGEALGGGEDDAPVASYQVSASYWRRTGNWMR